MLLRHTHVRPRFPAMPYSVACVHQFYSFTSRLPPPPASTTIWREHARTYSLMDLEDEFTGRPVQEWGCWDITRKHTSLTVSGGFPAWVPLSALLPGVHKFPISPDPCNFGIIQLFNFDIPGCVKCYTIADSVWISLTSNVFEHSPPAMLLQPFGSPFSVNCPFTSFAYFFFLFGFPL